MHILMSDLMGCRTDRILPSLKYESDFFKQETGAIGIGAMIIFIAMVLVAGIAASVIIQTSTRLESQAMSSGEQTTIEVSTGISVVDVEGHIGPSTTKIDRLVIMVRSRAGSKDIDLSTTLLEISDSTTKYILNYSTSHFASSPSTSGIFSTAVFSTLTQDDFGIIELEDADDSCDGTNPIINRGDKILLTMNASTTFGNNGIDVRTDIWGRVIPEEGAAGFIQFTTPGSFTDTVIQLQK
jgi:flagellin FlaB